MSVTNATCLGLLVIGVLVAVISASAMLGSVHKGDVGSAWGWMAIFVGSSLIAAWCFWRVA